jgi:ABC-type branched-subunit amino acid transport system substrate-binding protein
LPDFLPQGFFVIESAESSRENRTAFIVKLGGVAEFKRGSILVYDSVKALAQAIFDTSSSGTVDRDTINDALLSIDYWGDSGRIQFDEDGNRVRQTGEIWNTNSSVFVGSLNLSMTYDGNLLHEVLPPTFPGDSLVPTDDQTAWIPIVVSLSLTSNLVPANSQYMIITKFEYFIYWINTQPHLLPHNTKLVGIVVDNFGSPSTAVQVSLIATRIGAAAIFGDFTATLTAVTQSVVSAYGMPHLATVESSSLSSIDLYPTLIRTVSASDSEGVTILTMAKHFGWTELSIISTSENFGTDAASLMNNRAADYGITIEDHIVLDGGGDSYEVQLNALWSKKPQIVVILVASDPFEFLRRFYKTGYKPAAVITDMLSTLNITAYASVVGVPVSMFEGWVSIHSPVGIGQLWQDFIFNSTLADPIKWSVVPRMLEEVLDSALDIDSFIIIALSIKKVVESGQSPTNGTALLAAIKSFHDTLFSGDISFDDFGDRLPTFDLFNSINGRLVNKGRWTQASGLALKDQLVWTDGTTNVPVSSLPRDLQWLKWSSSAGIVFGILATLGIILCAATLILIYTWRESPLITSATYEFLILMLFGAALGFGSTLTWIGKPAPFICGLRIWLPPIAFLLIISPLMAKTWRLWKIFSLSSIRVVPVPLTTLILMVSAMVLVQIIICIVWVSLGTVQPIVVNDRNDRTQAYVLCKSILANRISSYVTFGYIGLILLVGCYLAFKIRKLPRDFNESKWIGRTLYNIFLFAGLIIILGYALSRFYVVVLILICVCTLAICYGSIMLMMGPKIWKLVRHPEKRSFGSSEQSPSWKRRVIGMLHLPREP